MDNTPRILIVDDEAAIRFMLQEALQDEGYQVTQAASAEEALTCLEADTFDLAMVDLKMTGRDGLFLLAQMRARWPQTGVILLTAYASLDSSIAALRHGALDYLIKPSSIEEICASVRRALIRQQSERHRRQLLQDIVSRLHELDATIEADLPRPRSLPEIRSETSPAQTGGLQLDLGQHTASLNGHSLDLTPTEFTLLATLVAAAGQVVSCRALARSVYGHDYPEVEARELIKSPLKRLRRKLQIDPATPNPLQNIRGVGYRWLPRW